MRKMRKWKMWAVISGDEIFAYGFTKNDLRQRGYLKPVRVEVRELAKKRK